jgi:hypothetical protein
MGRERCDSTVFAPMPNRTTIALVALLSAIFVKLGLKSGPCQLTK